MATVTAFKCVDADLRSPFVAAGLVGNTGGSISTLAVTYSGTVTPSASEATVKLAAGMSAEWVAASAGLWVYSSRGFAVVSRREVGRDARVLQLEFDDADLLGSTIGPPIDFWSPDGTGDGVVTYRVAELSVVGELSGPAWDPI